MEDAPANSAGRGSGDRRKTVSGAIPQQDHGNDEHDGRAMKFPWSSPSAPSSPVKDSFPTSPTSASAFKSSPPLPKAAQHRRSISGGIFTKLNSLLKSSVEDGPNEPSSPRSAKSRKSIDDEGTPVSPVSPPKGESAMAAALKPAKMRNRKGSLRKAALLGGKRAVTEGRERRNNLLQRSPTLRQPPVLGLQAKQTYGHISDAARDHPSDAMPPPDHVVPASVRRPLSYENANDMGSSDSGWSDPAALTASRLSLLTEHQPPRAGMMAKADQDSPVDLKSPVSQGSIASYASTTDDDDVLTFDRPANNYAAQQRESALLKKPISSTASSYFPSATSVSESISARSRSAKKVRSSPLSHTMTTLPTFPEPEPHDYTETEYWGWVILFVTWLTFTVGMGSCFEIWSWAWDVGETPYAPPELEDDPTLPIVGYYPALIVLTGVVAWVWITVAWVGMKYFRHAKIEV